MFPVVCLYIEIYRAVADICVSGIKYFLYEGYLFDDVSGGSWFDAWWGYVEFPHGIVVSDCIFLYDLHRFKLLDSCLFCNFVFS